jgi:hypothetical protein
MEDPHSPQGGSIETELQRIVASHNKVANDNKENFINQGSPLWQGI